MKYSKSQRDVVIDCDVSNGSQLLGSWDASIAFFLGLKYVENQIIDATIHTLQNWYEIICFGCGGQGRLLAELPNTQAIVLYSLYYL